MCGLAWGIHLGYTAVFQVAHMEGELKGFVPHWWARAGKPTRFMFCYVYVLCCVLVPYIPLCPYCISMWPPFFLFVPCLLCVALAGQFLGVYTSNPTPRSSSYSLSVSFCVTRPYGVAGRMGGFLLEASGIFWEPEILFWKDYHHLVYCSSTD